MKEAQVGNNGQDPLVLPVHPVPPGAPLSPNSIMASAQGVSFTLPSAEQYMILLEEQRRDDFCSLF